MDALEVICGSAVRAAVLGAMFEQPARRWRLADLARAAEQVRQSLAPDLFKLVECGVVAVHGEPPSRYYTLNAADPLTQALGRLVHQARGPVPRMREALVTLRTPAIAWQCMPPRSAAGHVRGVTSVSSGASAFVLTGAPGRLVARLLEEALPPRTLLRTMSVSEWLARLQKGDVLLRKARRARKLWIVGSWDELVAAEKRELETRRVLAWARANWREELSDEWDEDWDPLSSSLQAAGA